MDSSRQPVKVGLVLGAGGITGIAWLSGVARAVQTLSGWDPSNADIITGTSAGAVVATVLAAGQDPCDLLRFAEDACALPDAIALATTGRGPEGPALPWPGSLGLLAEGLVTRDPRHRVRSLAGLLPRGMKSGDEIRGLTYTATLDGWPTQRELWLHASDMRSGQLVSFGRPGAPEASLADAVVASCAVPAYYRPVRIGSRRYIDGGLRSLCNADLLAGEECDIVVILSPFSSTERGAPLDRAIFGAARGATASRTAREAALLRDAGAQVVVVEPTAADIRAMGLNPMERAHSRHVLETAEASALKRLGPLLEGIDLPVPRRRGVRDRLRLVA